MKLDNYKLHELKGKIHKSQTGKITFDCEGTKFLLIGSASQFNEGEEVVIKGLAIMGIECFNELYIEEIKAA